MTCEVIDVTTSWACAGPVNSTPVVPAFRYDASLRAVIWTDALLSAALALVAMFSPLLVVLPLPAAGAITIGLVVLAAALVLSGLGAVTALLLAARMRAGHGHIPPGLRLPLPAAMRPDLGAARSPGERVAGPGRGARTPAGPDVSVHTVHDDPREAGPHAPEHPGRRRMRPQGLTTDSVIATSSSVGETVGG